VLLSLYCTIFIPAFGCHTPIKRIALYDIIARGSRKLKKVAQTVFLHAELETLFEPAVLALVTMVLVHRTAVVSATRVR